jgi:hypothetical protein
MRSKTPEVTADALKAKRGESLSYEEFIAVSIERQLSVIQSEREKIREAGDLWLAYAAGMAKLNFHPLTFLEIGDRSRELEIMERDVHVTHGCSETMRALYEARFYDMRAPRPKQSRSSKGAKR